MKKHTFTIDLLIKGDNRWHPATNLQHKRCNLQDKFSAPLNQSAALEIHDWGCEDSATVIRQLKSLCTNNQMWFHSFKFRSAVGVYICLHFRKERKINLSSRKQQKRCVLLACFAAVGQSASLFPPVWLPFSLFDPCSPPQSLSLTACFVCGFAFRCVCQSTVTLKASFWLSRVEWGQGYEKCIPIIPHSLAMQFAACTI